MHIITTDEKNYEVNSAERKEKLTIYHLTK